MRSEILTKRIIAAAASGLLMIVLCLAVTCNAFAADDEQPADRQVRFTYGFTECTGDVHEVSDGNVMCEESSGAGYYSAVMMLCDTDHVVHVDGDGVTADNVTFTSSNTSVLDIDSAGNVTLKKAGTVRITATVAADDEYKECSAYLDVRVDRHEGWIESGPHYTDRPVSWGLDIDTADGPHQLALTLRPGASASYTIDNPNVANVDRTGMLTPLSAGTAQITIEIDSGGGRYKACRFGWTVIVTCNDLPERQAWFTYEYTDCIGKHFSLEKDDIGYYQEPSYYGAEMMMCDSDHVIHVKGDGVTENNVTMTSLDPDVLEVDDEGHVTIHKTGKAEIKATIAADKQYKECTVYLGVTVGKHNGWIETDPVCYEGRSPLWGLDLDTSDDPQKLVVSLRPGAGVKFTSDNTNVVLVDQNGVVTPVAAGNTLIRFDIDDGGGKYNEGYFLERSYVTGEDLRSDQQITGDTGPFTVDWHDGLQLELQAMTELEYSVVSGSFASVDHNGHVGFTQAGTARIRVTAIPSGEYRPAEITVTITARDYAAEEAARIEAEKAAQAAEARKAAAATASLKAKIAVAKTLRKPVLKVRALRGRKNKLTWSKVSDADGYIVYLKYPGRKKYVKAVTKNATVKSVTHKGLSRGIIYRYKVRAFKKVNGKTYYGPFSKVKKARAR